MFFKTCCLPFCKNTDNWGTKTGTFYDGKFVPFPRDPEKRMKWIQSLNLVNEPKNKAVICCEHFTDNCWKKRDVILNIPIANRKLLPDAVPVRKLSDQDDETNNSEVKEPMDEEVRKRLVAEAIAEYDKQKEKEKLKHMFNKNSKGKSRESMMNELLWRNERNKNLITTESDLTEQSKKQTNKPTKHPKLEKSSRHSWHAIQMSDDDTCSEFLSISTPQDEQKNRINNKPQNSKRPASVFLDDIHVNEDDTCSESLPISKPNNVKYRYILPKGFKKDELSANTSRSEQAMENKKNHSQNISEKRNEAVSVNQFITTNQPIYHTGDLQKVQLEENYIQPVLQLPPQPNVKKKLEKFGEIFFDVETFDLQINCIRCEEKLEDIIKFMDHVKIQHDAWLNLSNQIQLMSFQPLGTEQAPLKDHEDLLNLEFIKGERETLYLKTAESINLEFEDSKDVTTMGNIDLSTAQTIDVSPLETVDLGNIKRIRLEKPRTINVPTIGTKELATTASVDMRKSETINTDSRETIDDLEVMDTTDTKSSNIGNIEHLDLSKVKSLIDNVPNIDLEKDFKFIEKIVTLWRENSLLWDKEHREFNNYTKKYLKICEIVAQLNHTRRKTPLTPFGFQMVLAQLTKAYAKDYERCKRLTKERQDAYRPKFWFYHGLEFLKKNMKREYTVEEEIKVASEFPFTIDSFEKEVLIMDIIESFEKTPSLWKINDPNYQGKLNNMEEFLKMYLKIYDLQMGKNLIIFETDCELYTFLECLIEWFRSVEYLKESPEIDGISYPHPFIYDALNFLQNQFAPFKCSICKTIYRSEQFYLRHITTNPSDCSYILKGTTFPCQYCSKTFAKKSNYIVHTRQHTDERPYACKICGKPYITYSSYYLHLKTHQKTRPFSCDMCDHSFYTKYLLEIHKKTHLNMRDKICDVCGKGFNSNRQLFRHKTIHSKIKKFKCHYCGDRFQTANANYDHMRRCKKEISVKSPHNENEISDSVESSNQETTNKKNIDRPLKNEANSELNDHLDSDNLEFEMIEPIVDITTY